MQRRQAIASAVLAAALQALAPSAAAGEPMGTDVLLKDPRFRAGLTAALGPAAGERWIATLANSAPVIDVRVAGTAWLQATPCKPRDCAENNLLLLYSRATGEVVGLLHAKGRHGPVGNAPPPLAAALETLWKKEFRQQ